MGELRNAYKFLVGKYAGDNFRATGGINLKDVDVN
jgi:hypothetical protein